MTGEQKREGDGVRITQREVYDIVIDMRGDLRTALATIPTLQQQGSDHSLRIRDLEAWRSTQLEIAGTVATLATTVQELSVRVARSEWVPRLVFAVLGTVLGGTAVGVIVWALTRAA